MSAMASRVSDGVDVAAVQAVAAIPPSLSFPHKGGGDPQMDSMPLGEAGFSADLRATALMFGAGGSTSSPPPLWGRDREGGTPPVQVRTRRDADTSPSTSPDLLAALAIFADAGVRHA